MALDWRQQNSSDESATSISSALRADIQLTNQLSAFLDKQHNELVQRGLGLPENPTPELILRRVLTPDSFFTTPSSFATFQQSQRAFASSFRSIGFGQCGLVFERPGRNYAIKVAKSAYETGLWSDFVCHYNVYKAFDQQIKTPECRVPRLFSFIPKTHQQWWVENLPSFTEVHSSLSLPGMALITERIPPLPKIGREALIDKYCAPSSRAAVAANSTNRDCLARVYLGRRRPANAQPPPNFTLRNFNLCLDQMIELGLPLELYATAMGEALAIIHWAARVDGYDIEIVLGSEGDVTYSRDVHCVLDLTPEEAAALPPFTNIESLMTVDFKRRTTRLWVLDFNLCNPFSEEVAQEHPEALTGHLVTAFFENDPYYPLPLMDHELDQKLWDSFSAQYLDKGKEILEGPGQNERLAILPRMFIDGCVSREQENLVNGVGHGHRENKQ